MAFDGIVLKQVVKELQTCLIGGKINKVYEPNQNEILLGIYANGKNYCLLSNISASSYRLHLTTTSKPNPLNAPNFCMLLRKHLTRISHQIDFYPWLGKNCSDRIRRI